MLLAIYDLSGIQSFVFAANSLKEIVGATEIIHEALFVNIPNLLKTNENDWMEKDFSFSENDAGKIVYIGGGNALIAFSDLEQEADFTRKLTKLIFLQSGGGIKLCHASIEVDFEKSLAENQKTLMEKLDQQKRITPVVTTAKGFSINAHDNASFEPIVLHENNLIATKKGFQKLKAFESAKSFDHLKIKDDDGSEIQFTNQFEYFSKKGYRNFVSIIHIDGNTMGIKIRNFVQGRPKSEDLIQSLDALRKMSAEINATYISVVKETINEISWEKDINNVIPFRPIILDGDDITVICRAEYAFEFVEIFMQKLSDRHLQSFFESGNASDDRLTAGTGIAFVKTKFPFHTGYDIAEQCCKNAKKYTRERNPEDVSSVDFHVCTGGVTTNITDYRKEKYEYQSGDSVYQLNLRPYYFDENNADEDYFNYKTFKRTQQMLIDPKQLELGDSIARSKLKGLRNIYTQGSTSAKIYGDYLQARHSGKGNEEIANILSEIFVMIDSKNFGKYFDVLDILDIVNNKTEGVN